MALTTEQWDKINEATTALRAMGCAVCVFTPDDVESAAEENEIDITPERAAAWMEENRKVLEDGMSQYGNQTIEDGVLDLGQD